MSGRTRKKGERIPLDAYYTDERVALAITREVMRHIIIMDDPPLRVMEPHVGGGAFIKAFKSFNNPKIKYTAMDLNPEAEGLALAITQCRAETSLSSLRTGTTSASHMTL
jgi:hypothetical protein